MGRQHAYQLYRRDLSDVEWQVIKPLIPVKTGRGKRCGLPYQLSMWTVLNARCSLARTGCPWDYLPRTSANHSSVRYYYDTWRKDETWERITMALRQALRQQDAHHSDPSATIIDSQRVKTTEMGGPTRDDASKKVKGCKRHRVVDTMGLLRLVVVHPANRHDRNGAGTVLQKLSEVMTRLCMRWADGSYAGFLVARVKTAFHWTLTIISRPAAARSFVVLPRRWVVERTLAWFGHNPRLSKDDEKLLSSSETVVSLATIRLLVCRLAQAT